MLFARYCILFCLLCFSSRSLWAEEASFYAGLGAGLASLDVDLNNSGFTESDNQSFIGRGLFGYHFNSRLSTELMWSQGATVSLNSAAGSEQEIDSNLLAISGFYYPWGGISRSWAPYISLGAVHFDASSSFSNFDGNSGIYVLGGVGVQYQWASDWSARLGFEQHTADGNQLAFSVIKRFGSQKDRPVAVVSEAPVVIAEIPPEPKPIPAPVPIVKPVEKVSAKVCQLFNSRLDGVGFIESTSTLTRRAKALLGRVANILKRYPSVMVEVQGHIRDLDLGSRRAELKLSQQRADVVRRYLEQVSGVRGRLEAKGYGADVTRVTDPQDPRNSRIEFKLQNPSICQ